MSYWIKMGVGNTAPGGDGIQYAVTAEMTWTGVEHVVSDVRAWAEEQVPAYVERWAGAASGRPAVTAAVVVGSRLADPAEPFLVGVADASPAEWRDLTATIIEQLVGRTRDLAQSMARGAA